MTSELVSATATIKAPAETVFAVLADPANHAAIDGTGWVQGQLDTVQLTGPGQVFRIAMHHDYLPTKNYEMANRVQVFDRPRVISWEPGQNVDSDDDLQVGGWVWRYDLRSISPSETEVTLSYDWSAVPPFLREHIPFPPFGPDHLDNSLSHLAQIAGDSHGDTKP